jgi:hypothetical protein
MAKIEMAYFSRFCCGDATPSALCAGLWIDKNYINQYTGINAAVQHRFPWQSDSLAAVSSDPFFGAWPMSYPL